MNGMGLPYPSLWFGPGLLWMRKLQGWSFHFMPSFSSAATDANPGNELETQSTNTTTVFAPAVSGLQSQKGGLPWGWSLQTSSPRPAECGSNGSSCGISAACATMPGTSLRDDPHLYYCSRSSGSPWFHQAGLVGEEEQVCSQLG